MSGETIGADVPVLVVRIGLPDECTGQAGLRRVVRELAAAAGRLRVLVDVDPDDELGRR